MEARAKLIPSTNTIDWLSAFLCGALNVAISIRASIPAVGSCSLNNISAASLLLVQLFVILASIILAPSSQAIHRLGTALSGALLVGVDIRASIAIVGSIDADGISSAPPVLVVSSVMFASTIRAPVSNAVNRLAATVGGALDLRVLKWTLLAVQVSLCCHLVSFATLVLVAICNMLAASIRRPLTLTVNRLAATALGAVLELIVMWASKTVVSSSLAHTVDTATLILMIGLLVVTSVVGTPSANTVNRLGAALCGALLVII